jgi:trehalose utilization protein
MSDAPQTRGDQIISILREMSPCSMEAVEAEMEQRYGEAPVITHTVLIGWREGGKIVVSNGLVYLPDGEVKP